MCSANIRPIILIVGTRPEGIKMIPLYKKLKQANIPTSLCSTMQHDELLSQVFDIFDVKPDFNLAIMRQGQDLFYLTQSILQKTKEVFKKINPSLVLVQGDTTSTMAAALAAFYLKIPVGHVEAGLRTDDIMQPFPEEVNRRMVSLIAKYHFAPTAHSAGQLLAQGINQNDVFCTGNTVVDALKIIQEKISLGKLSIREDIKKLVDTCTKKKKKIILLTTHRRESFDGGISRILQSVKDFLQENDDVFCFYPFHPNPHVIQEIENSALSEIKNIYLCEPVSYKEMVHLISNSNLILTDSGGIQEEAVSLGKPVLVLREKTERAEGVWAGLAKIVGTDEIKIKNYIKKYINYERKNIQNIYGDGYASDRIVEILQENMPQNSLRKNNLSYEKITNTNDPFSEKTKNRELNMEKVCVLGLGYIGLPTAIVLAESGFDVLGFDIDKNKVKSINAGDPIIEEPEIFEKLQPALTSRKFRASTEIETADYFVIAVPTPFKDNKSSDLSYVFSATESITLVIKKGDTVLLESTVGVGATQQIANLIENRTNMKAGEDFFVAHCPERVLPGKIFKELIENDRVVGGINKKSTQMAALLYARFVNGEIYLTDSKTAEIVKLIENSSRDAQIAFAHQVASMAKSAKLNPYEIIELANKHPRVNILKPTCGVGGHCIAIDPWFLVESFPKNSKLTQTVRSINDDRPKEVLELIERAIEKFKTNNQEKCNLLLLGLTYKPDVDDLRESPALLIAKTLCNKKDINLLIAEPHIKQKKLFDLFTHEAISVSEGIQKANIIVYLVGHKRFKAIDKKSLEDKIILDFCGITYKTKTALNPKNDIKKWKTSSILDFFITNTKDCDIKNKEE